jgi:hypothetical protein
VKTLSGYETDGTFVKYQHPYTKFWIVETADNRINHFYSEQEADEYLVKRPTMKFFMSNN